MSRRKQNLRAFLHQMPNATVEQAWDAAWEGAQKRYHSRTMQELEAENAELRNIIETYDRTVVKAQALIDKQAAALKELK